MSRKSADYKITITGIMNLNTWNDDKPIEGKFQEILSSKLKSLSSSFLNDVDAIELEVAGITEGYRYTGKSKQEMELESKLGRLLKKPEVLAGKLLGVSN